MHEPSVGSAIYPTRIRMKPFKHVIAKTYENAWARPSEIREKAIVTQLAQTNDGKRAHSRENPQQNFMLA